MAFIHCLLRLRLPIVSSIKNMDMGFKAQELLYEWLVQILKNTRQHLMTGVSPT